MAPLRLHSPFVIRHSPMPTAPLRDAFVHPPAPAAELRAFTHGLMPRTVPALMQAFCDDWAARGVDAWNHVPNHWRPHSGESVGWWTLPLYLGDHFVAPMLAAPPGTCAMQPNVHWTVQCLLSAPETWRAGRHVVIPDDAFPSTLHSLHRWSEGLGLDVQVVPAGAGGLVDEAAVIAALRPDTALVVLSHVSFVTGEKLTDGFLRRVADGVHAGGGLLAVDGYHATAQFPIHVEAVGADVYMGGLLKEGCGASGNAYVYVRRGLEITPRATGWFGDAQPFGFGPAPTAHPDVRQRFLGGTTAVASLYHSVEGLRVLMDFGFENVQRHVAALTGECLERADALGLEVVSPRERDRRAALVVLRVPEAHQMAEYLKTRHVFVDSRRDTLVRLAPFVWNGSDDVARAFDEMGAALRGGLHRHVTVVPGGPVT